MRVKLSITMSEDLLRRIDASEPNRSAFLEKAARTYLSNLDLEIINRNAYRLNREAADVLEYQLKF